MHDLLLTNLERAGGPSDFTLLAKIHTRIQSAMKAVILHHKVQKGNAATRATPEENSQ